MRTNEDSGFKWGPFNLKGARPWRLMTEQLGGSVEYPHRRAKASQDITEVDLTRPIIHKGNDFQRFTHYRQYPSDCLWYFWDNCLIPQFMMPSRANPEGGKIWCRLVRGAQFPGGFTGTEQDLVSAEARVNREILALGGEGTWRDLIEVPPVEPQGRRALVCLPSPDCLQAYWGMSIEEFTQRCLKECRSQGYQTTFRPKQNRRERLRRTFEQECREQGYSLVIGCGSAVGVEAINLGMAYVSWGGHSLDTLATDWDVFARGFEGDPDYRPFKPTRSQAIERFRQSLLTVWSKRQLITGEWSLHRDLDLLEPWRPRL